jgi:hypothetical protein
LFYIGTKNTSYYSPAHGVPSSLEKYNPPAYDASPSLNSWNPDFGDLSNVVVSCEEKKNTSYLKQTGVE